MAIINMQVSSLLTAVVAALLMTQVAALPPGAVSLPYTISIPPPAAPSPSSHRVLTYPPLPQSSLVANYTPSNWIPEYGSIWCRADTTQIPILPIFAYYPFPPQRVFDIVGSFVNITWINPAFNDTTYIRIGNTSVDDDPTHPVIERTQPKFTLGKVEDLISYEVENSTAYGGGLYHQQAAHLSLNHPITVGPGLFESDSHTVLELKPACNGIGSQVAFYLTYCFDNATIANALPPFDFDVAAGKLTDGIVKGTEGALGNLWRILDGDRRTVFNSTGSCEAIRGYQTPLGDLSQIGYTDRK